MTTRDVYLKIEQVFANSTVEPEFQVAPPKQYRRDCMRNPGHESTVIPPAEIEARRLSSIRIPRGWTGNAPHRPHGHGSTHRR